MAIDLLIQPFYAGQSMEVPSAPVKALLDAATRSSEPGFVRIQVGSAGADVYADLEGDTLSSLMVSRPERGIEELIVEIAKAANAVILIPDGPALLIDEVQRDQLPSELAHRARLAKSGGDLAAAIT